MFIYYNNWIELDIPFSPNTTIRDILNNESEYLLLCKKVIKGSIPFIQQPISTVLFCYNHMYSAFGHPELFRSLPHRGAIFHYIVPDLDSALFDI